MTPEKELHNAEMLIRSFEISLKHIRGQEDIVKQIKTALTETKKQVTRLKKEVKKDAK